MLDDASRENVYAHEVELLGSVGAVFSGVASKLLSGLALALDEVVLPGSVGAVFSGAVRGARFGPSHARPWKR